MDKQKGNAELGKRKKTKGIRNTENGEKVGDPGNNSFRRGGGSTKSGREKDEHCGKTVCKENGRGGVYSQREKIKKNDR